MILSTATLLNFYMTYRLSCAFRSNWTRQSSLYHKHS